MTVKRRVYLLAFLRLTERGEQSQVCIDSSTPNILGLKLRLSRPADHLTIGLPYLSEVLNLFHMCGIN